MSGTPEPASILEAVAEQLVSLRSARGLDLDFVAADARIEPQRLASAEAAELALDEEELERLAAVYHVGLTTLFGGRTTPLEYFLGA